MRYGPGTIIHYVLGGDEGYYVITSFESEAQIDGDNVARYHYTQFEKYGEGFTDGLRGPIEDFHSPAHIFDNWVDSAGARINPDDAPREVKEYADRF